MEMDHESERNSDGNSQLYCQYCGECSTSMSELTQHIVAEHEDGEDNHVEANVTVGETETVQENSSGIVFQFYCQFCGESLHSFKELEEHIEIEHENGNETEEITLNNDASTVYEEGLEGKKVGTEHGAIKTNKKNDGGKTVVHKCQFCTAAFADRDAFEKHVEEGHDELEGQTKTVDRTIKMSTDVLKIGTKEYLCPLCCATFNKHFEVLRHIINIHKKEIKDSDSKGIVNMFSKCGFCEKLFTCDSELAIHTNRHTKEFAYICPFCPSETYAEKDAVQHMKRVHKAEKFDKKSILKVKNPKPLAVTKMHIDTSNIKVLKLCDDLEEEAEVSISPEYKPGNIFKCPYCSFDTSNGKSLNNHVKTTHRKTFNKETLLQTDKISVTQKSPETFRKSGEIEINNVAFYYQCQFCSYKSPMKANIVRHLNSTIHSEEKKKGLFKNLDISKLKVNNQRAKDPLDGVEKKVNGDVPKVQISGIKVQVRGRQKEESLDNESTEQVNFDKSVKGGIIEEKGNCTSSSGEEQLQDTVMKSLELSKNQPFIKLERMKLPVSVPKSDLKKTNQGDTKEKSDKTVLDSEDNACPYCDFQSKRASALKFHINFNHKGRTPEILARKRKREDETKHIAKKSKPDNISASKKERLDKDNEVKHTMVINVDGTVVVEDNVEGTGLKQGSFDDVPLSENTDIENAEINMSRLERSKRQRNVKVHVVGAKAGFDKQDVNEVTEMDNEMILYACTYCNKRLKSLQSVKKHVKSSHPKQLFSYEDIKVVIEEYKGPSYVAVPDKKPKPSKLEEGRYRCPFCPKFSQWMKKIRMHIEIVHKDKGFNENDIIIEKDNEGKTELDAQSKTVPTYGPTYGCLFCKDRFESQASAQKHMKRSHEGKGLKAGNVLVLDRSSLQQTDKLEGMKTRSRKINDPEESSRNKEDMELSQFQCPKCKLTFNELKDALKHVHSEHKDESNQVKNEPSTEYVDTCTTKNNGDAAEFFKCPHCEEIFKFRDDVQEHLSEYHGKKEGDDKEIVVMLHSADADTSAVGPALDHERFQCPVCDLQLRWKHSILKHARKYHPEHPKITAETIKPVANKTLVERYFCPYCFLSFRWKNSVPRHVGRKHQDKIDEFNVDDMKTLLVNINGGEGETEDTDDNDTDDDLHRTMKSKYTGATEHR